MSMQIRCGCGYTGPADEAPGKGIRCPRCETPVKEGATLTTANLASEVRDDRLIVRVRAKNVKLAESEQLIRVVFETHKGVARVIIDLQGVEYLGSSAISALVRIAIERRLRLVHVTEAVVKTMRTMGVASYFTMHPDLASALAEG